MDKDDSESQIKYAIGEGIKKKRHLVVNYFSKILKVTGCFILKRKIVYFQ